MPSSDVQTDLRPTASIAPGSYFDETIALEEQNAIFRKVWIFVGFRRELANHNDYLQKDIGGVSVVIQNFDGEIRAFHNVCSHRLSMIRNDCRGNGPLRCPYHGWTYDGEGVPVGIPGNHQHFCFGDAEKRSLALRSFAVGVCGEFVFVRIAPEGPDLEEYLGSSSERLLHLSEHFGRNAPIDEQVVPWETNWKIGMESVLEVYHVDPVHPDTFKKLVKTFWKFEAEGIHSTALSLLQDDMKGWWDKAIGRLGLRKSPRCDEYDHFVIFPNIAIGLTRGVLMSFQTYEPVSPTRSNLHYRMILANTTKPESIGGYTHKSVADTVVEFNRKLLKEDQTVSEYSQRGLMQSPRRAILGINEGRIEMFHNALKGYVDYPA